MSRMSVTTTESTTTLQKGFVGQSMPRKEDPARRGAGRSLRRRQAPRDGVRPLRALAVRPCAHRVDRRQRRARAARRLRHAHRRRGRDPHRPVLPDRRRSRRPGEGLRARRRQGALHRRARRRSRRADAELARDASELVSSTTSRSTSSSTRGRRSRTGAVCCTRRPAETCPTAASGNGATSTGLRRGRPRREDLRAPLRPLQLDAARARRRARRVQPRHGAVDDHDEQPVPRVRGDHDGARDAGRDRQAPHRHAGHRRRLRQQDHVASAARRLLPARAEAQPADPVDRVADRLPPVDVARERALVPRHRGRGEGRRDDARLPDEGDRRRGRIPLRAARRRDLVAGLAGDVRLAQPARRVHAGDDEQGARLRTAATRACSTSGSRSGSSTSSRRARLRPGRAAEAQLRPARGDALRDAERLRLRLRRLPERARHGAGADRLRHDRGAPPRRPPHAGSCSGSGSGRPSTRGRTTSASRSS